MSAIRQNIQLFIDKNLSQQARSQFLANEARAGLAQALQGGSSPFYQSFVDRQLSTDLDHAKSQISFRFGYAPLAAAFALAFLLNRAQPIGNEAPHFADSFWIATDDTYHAPGSIDPADIDPFTDEVIIGNTRPYNRRIDVGLVGTRKLSYRIPAGIYDDCARAVSRQFKGIVTAMRAYDYQFPQKYAAKKATYRFQSPVVILSIAQ
jgi:hypothetical protein